MNLLKSFPTRCAAGFAKFYLCAMPAVIVFKTPDIYSMEPTMRVAKFLAIALSAAVAFAWALRAAGVDIDRLFDHQRFLLDGGRAGYARRWALNRAAWALLLMFWIMLAFSGTVWIPLLLLGTFWAFHAAARGGADTAELSFGRAAAGAILFIVAVAAGWRLSAAGDSAYRIVTIGILAATGLASTIPVLSAFAAQFKYRKTGMDGRCFLSEFGAAAAFFAAPLLKLFFFFVTLYYAALFPAFNERVFVAVAVAAAAATLAWRRFGRGLPFYARAGAFTGYVLFIWGALLYVQSYNRIPPTAAECAAVTRSPEVRPLLSLEQYRAVDYLSGGMPYDVAYDDAENALFVTFKNLNRYGSIVRVDASGGGITGGVVTENNTEPGRMFYPERLCINKKRKILYSTTKTHHNFQLLEFDYSRGGLRLTDRILFTGYETTNCEVDPRTENVYVIFLGPPNNNIQALDPRTRERVRWIQFGVLGYADYFALDPVRDRIIVPSLDPVRHFDIYDVIEKKYMFFTVRRPMALTARLPLGVEIALPLPTLGIAHNVEDNRFYFTSPFARLVFETSGLDFKIRRKLSGGRFPRELAWNPRSRILFSANYAGGTVDAIDVDKWKIVRTWRLGKLARSVVVDEETGRNFAVTACGVFELDVKGRRGKTAGEKTTR